MGLAIQSADLRRGGLSRRRQAHWSGAS